MSDFQAQLDATKRSRRVRCKVCGESFRPRKDGTLRTHVARVKGPRGGKLLKPEPTWRESGDRYCPGGPKPAWK